MKWTPTWAKASLTSGWQNKERPEVKASRSKWTGAQGESKDFKSRTKKKGTDTGFATKEFLVSGSFEKNGPWKTLIQDKLTETTGGRSADLLNFTMDKPVKIKFLKFELVSFWGEGGGLQYFAPIPAT